MREYETIVIVHPDALDEGVHRVSHRVKDAVARQGGTLFKVDLWGKRKLAYSVHKQTKGTYVNYQYVGERGTVEELERTLRMLETVIKYQTVKVSDSSDVAGRQVEESANLDFLAAAEKAAADAAVAKERGEIPEVVDEVPAEPPPPEDEFAEEFDGEAPEMASNPIEEGR